MARFVKTLKEKIKREDSLIKANSKAISQQNMRTLRAILIASILIFSVNSLFSFLSSQMSGAGYTGLRWAYLAIAIVAIGFYATLKIFPKIQSVWIIYLIYCVSVIYCIFTSAFLATNYISITILAVLFQMPILYLDNSVRINLFTLFSGIVYLLFIWKFKTTELAIDETVNLLSFLLISIIIGSFVRKIKLENFSMEAKLQYLSLYDPLTGIANRRKLLQDIQSVEKDEEHNLKGIAIADIDFFKKYNDTYGHQKGDQCLKTIADCFLRFENTGKIQFYRYGGEEFAILFLNCSPEESVALSTEIKEAIDNLNIDHKGSEKGNVTISIGIATLNEDIFQKWEYLLLCADKALYNAKTSGRNSVAVHNDSEEDKAHKAHPQKQGDAKL